jgi:DNA-binding transcriptional LysR family regulator
MTLQQIYYALTVSESGSMNQAAEKLYISQPTLTSAIHALEEEVHITIFNRTSRGVSLTNEGKDFLLQARQIYQQYELLQDKYSSPDKIHHKFKVSAQHYSFATKAFVETVKKYGTSKYNLEISETRTMDVINDVGNSNSEIGILYLSNYNRKYLQKLFNEKNLEFHRLVKANAFVYLYKKHPLAKNKSITFEQLKEYPNMSFDQGENSSFYLGEEILGQNEYPRTIKVNDRATMLNLMRGLNGYTLCSGIISEELNGTDYVAVPYQADRKNPNAVMEIGYIIRSHTILSDIAENYINELNQYFES